MNRKLIGILVMALLIGTSLPVIGHINEREPYLILKRPTLNNNQKNTISVNNDVTVLWDNGLHYQFHYPVQWDPLFPFDSFMADDFQFEETKVITGVNWIGGYYNPAKDTDYDWNLTFYNDAGDGNTPVEEVYNQFYTNEEVHETYLDFFEFPEDPRSNAYMFTYWVDLIEPITFNANQQYWISITGHGAFPPQTTWGIHKPVVNHATVVKSEYWEHPKWEDNYFAVGDACFQLTGEGDEPITDLEGGGTLNWNAKAGSMVNGTITISNEGDIGSMLEWKVQSYPEDWGTDWKILWSINGTIIPDYALPPDQGGFVGPTNHEDVFIEVQAPSEKNSEFTGEIVLVNVDNPDDTCTINLVCKTPKNRVLSLSPFIERLLEHHPHMLTILEQIFSS